MAYRDVVIEDSFPAYRMRGFVASMADTCFYGNDQAKFAKSKISLDLSLSLTTENRTAFTSEYLTLSKNLTGFRSAKFAEKLLNTAPRNWLLPFVGSFQGVRRIQHMSCRA